MTRHKDILNESSLTGTNGADTVSGTNTTLNTTSPIKGIGSATTSLVAGTASYQNEGITASNDLYVAGYVRIDTLPAVSFGRICEIRSSAGLLCALQAGSAGTFRLTLSTNVATGSSYTFTVGTAYRFGLEYHIGTGADGILRLYIATGDDGFGAPLVEVLNGVSTTQANVVRIGNPVGTSRVDVTFDNVRIDDTSMPTDDVVGSGYQVGSLLVLQNPVYRM